MQLNVVLIQSMLPSLTHLVFSGGCDQSFKDLTEIICENTLALMCVSKGIFVWSEVQLHYIPTQFCLLNKIK